MRKGFQAPSLIRRPSASSSYAAGFYPHTPPSIGFIAEKLHRSQAEAEAILLRAGVFVQTSPGVWGLDPHFGSAHSVSLAGNVSSL